MGLASLLMLAFSFHGTAQPSISRTNEKVILESCRQTLLNYTRYLELLAQEGDKQLASLYKAELFKSFVKDSVLVFNDLIPTNSRPARAQENMERLTTYLDDLSSRYQQGVLLTYGNFSFSPVFIDVRRNRFFVKATADRSLDGMYFYKSERSMNSSSERMDLYLQVDIRQNGVPESKIYSVTDHQNNEDTFLAVKVVEKSVPIAFVMMVTDTVIRRGMEHSVAWTGGELFERLGLSLFVDEAGTSRKALTIDSSFVNDNGIKFLLPTGLKTGKGHRYHLEINRLNSEEPPSASQPFYLRRKTPLILKIAVPAVVTGGLVWLFINASKTTEDPVLPAPPGGPGS